MGRRLLSLLVLNLTMLNLVACGGRNMKVALKNETATPDSQLVTAAPRADVDEALCLTGASEECKIGMHSKAVVYTPTGAKFISTLKVGDKVFSGPIENRVVAKIQAVRRLSVGAGYQMIRMKFHTGLVLVFSKHQPIDANREASQIQIGDYLGNMRVDEVGPYASTEVFTYDILTDTDGGAYHVGNAKGVARIESTLGVSN